MEQQKRSWKFGKQLLILGVPILSISACGGDSNNSAQGTMSMTTAVANTSDSVSSDNATAIGTSASTSASTATSSDAIVQTQVADLKSASQLLAAVSTSSLEKPVPLSNAEGTVLTTTATGTIDLSNAFFQAFGNGRSCASCHQESQAWSVRPDSLQQRFIQTNGTDPIFNVVDGATSPKDAVGTLDQKRIAYSMLLTKGLIRIGLPIPNGAQFVLAAVNDPYNFASASQLSLFRRPLPTTNLKFENTLMWDGRETFTSSQSNLCVKGTAPPHCFATPDFDLLHQANGAVITHAQSVSGLSAAQQRAIVNLEASLFTAQISSTRAGSLTDAGARGGPLALAVNTFYFGINDINAGDYQTGATFNQNVMLMYSSWVGLDAPTPGAKGKPPLPPTAVNVLRASIARGEQIFNTKPFNISGVAGFNDQLRASLQRGTCASCHSTPAVGTQSVPRLFNTGVSGANLRTPDMPLYTLKNSKTGEVVQTTDPGFALTTGQWQDIGRFKVPALRALAARGPYFHNGSAADIPGVIRFYERRFNVGFTPQEVNDLTEFLKVL
ncbi:cytochrome C [Undibacterium sp. SXout11W]|uniref:cytochrome C n=1 Tax=Undibacterium sp. SXout11W TaxID=3413050 RepID=UPI003BF13775